MGGMCYTEEKDKGSERVDIIVLKEEHRASFSHLLPEALAQQLGGPGTFSLGLLDRREDGFHPVGILMAQVGESDVEILWIYVEPELRFQGAGTRLLRSLISILKREKTAGTLAAFLDSRSEYTYFFLFNDFDIITASREKLFETTVGALAEGKLGSFTVPRGVIPFSQVPNVYLRAFSQKAQKRGEDALVSFPLRREDYLPCSVAMVEHEEITGVLLFAEDEGQEGFSMVYRYVLAEDSRRAAAMACASVHAMAKQYPCETPVRLMTMDKISQIIAGTSASPAEETELVALTYQLEGGDGE